MRELRLHRDIYDGAAVDEAIAVFTPYARIERSEEEEAWLIQINAERPELERRIEGELGNYALGLTIRTHGGA